MRVSKKKPVGFNYLKDLEFKKLQVHNEVLVYECQQYHSIGRTICYLVRKLKKMDLSSVSAILVTDVEKTIFKRDPKEALAKYKRYYAAGNQTKGPFTPKSEVGLFKKLLRNNLKYKNEDKILFKKICVFTSRQYDAKFSRDVFRNLKAEDPTYRMRRNVYGLKIKLDQLIARL